MRIAFPKNSREFYWTDHIKKKMVFYSLSEQRLLQILRNFNRCEDGIAPRTVAYMKRNDKAKRQEELWIMAQKNKARTIMISAWRYPGVSRLGKELPMPSDVASEISDVLEQELLAFEKI